MSITCTQLALKHDNIKYSFRCLHSGKYSCHLGLQPATPMHPSSCLSKHCQHNSVLRAATGVPWRPTALPAVLPGLPILSVVPLPPAEEQRWRSAILYLDWRRRPCHVGVLQDLKPSTRGPAGGAGKDDELGGDVHPCPAQFPLKASSQACCSQCNAVKAMMLLTG